MKITMAHGSGGQATSNLIDEIFGKYMKNDILDQMEDSSVMNGYKKIAMTTDSFVIDPIEFRGGDIGKLAVCGTVNDLLMRGATPRYLTCGFILEEGLDTELLERVVKSMAATAKEANVLIVAGDTKVIGGDGGLYINTAGVGFMEHKDVNVTNIKPGDAIIVSGYMGDHYATVLSHRLSVDNSISSDCAPLNDIVLNLLDEGIDVHAMRDVTRGGLATVLAEMAKSSSYEFVIEEDKIPVSDVVKDFCGILGLDPLYMGNEGKMIAIVSKEHEQQALSAIVKSNYGQNAKTIGYVKEDKTGKLIMKTKLGGRRPLGVLKGEGLPRIC